jgi:hypothetical protein
MANFVLLYGGGAMPESESERAQVMEAWGAWFGSLGGDLVDGGNPFTPQEKRIGADGSVSDGPASASGYSIIKADSMDAAVAAAKRCPVLQGGADIRVYETFPVM